MSKNVVEYSNKVASLIKNLSPAIKDSLPKHLNGDRMLRIVTTELKKNPKLMNCKQHGLISAICQASALGLEVGTGIGHAHLIPYGQDATLVIGYQGLCMLAHNSGKVKSFYAHAVYAKDDFRLNLGTDLCIEHTPCFDEERGDIVGFYAVVHYVSGGFDVEWMTKKQVDKVRNGSPGKNASPWKQHYEEMGRKTVIRRLAKRAPLSPEFQRAAVIDSQMDDPKGQEFDMELEAETMEDEIMDQEIPVDIGPKE